MSEHAIYFCVGEDKIDVQEKRSDRASVLSRSAKADGGLSGGLRPVADGEVGQDEQRLPDVGSAIVQFGRDLGLGGCDAGGMLLDEMEAAFFEGRRIEIPGTVALFPGGLSLHSNDDAAVGQGVGETANF